MKKIAWKIYIKNKLVDIVYFNKDLDEIDVYYKLIGEGYSPRIRLKK